MNTYDPNADMPGPPPRKSIFPKLLAGCGCLFLLGILSCGGIGFFGYRAVMKQVDEFAVDFEAQGYERREAKQLVVVQSVDTPTIFVGQVVQVNDGVNSDIAIAGQVVEINGEVNGNIDFYGQVLTVKPGAKVNGDIRCSFAQVVDLQGEVTGEVTGDYQVLNPSPQAVDDVEVNEVVEGVAEELPAELGAEQPAESVP